MNQILRISVEDLTPGSAINRALEHARRIDLGANVIEGTAEYNDLGEPVDVEDGSYGCISIDIERAGWLQ